MVQVAIGMVLFLLELCCMFETHAHLDSLLYANFLFLIYLPLCLAVDEI